MFGKIKRDVTRLDGPVRIQIEERLDGWWVYAFIGFQVVLNGAARSEADAHKLADQYETELHKRGY